MKRLKQERGPLPRPAVFAAFGAVVCVALACAVNWVVTDSPNGAQTLMGIAILAALAGVFGASAFWFSVSAMIAGLGVVLFAADNLAAVIIAASCILAALQLFDASRVLRRAPEIDRSFLSGRLATNGGLAFCGAIMTVTVTVVAQSRIWAAALIPAGIATVSIGLLSAWFLIHRQNRAAAAARTARAKQNFQPPPPSPIARPVSFDASPPQR